jgi:hypothetical protein
MFCLLILNTVLKLELHYYMYVLLWLLAEFHYLMLEFYGRIPQT